MRKNSWRYSEEPLPGSEKEIELGRMLKVSMTVPRYHTTEDGDGTIASPSSSRTPRSPTTILTAPW